MIKEIITYRKQGMSFRKIAEELNSTVGKVHYQWIKNARLMEEQFLSNEHEEVPTPVHPIGCYLISKLIQEQKVFSSWEIASWQKQQLVSYFKDDINLNVLILRIYDVTDIYFNGLNAHSYFEFQIPPNKRNWTIKGIKSGRNYLTEIGFKIKENQFFPILRSNPVGSYLNDSKLSNNFPSHQNGQPEWGQRVSTYSYYENMNEANKDYE
ncbi:DUF4912 domain-containing protein [Pseudoneobacillus sp. C159]